MASVSLYSSASPRMNRRRHSWSELFARYVSRPRNKTLARLKSLVYVCAGLLAIEGIVRLAEYSAGSSLSDTQRVAAAKLPAGAWLRGRYVNSWGYWDDEFDGAAPYEGTRRIALLGDASLLAGNAQTNIASQLEDRLSHTEVDHFAVAAGGPREFAAQFPSDVVRRAPHAAIVCLTMTPVVAAPVHDERFTQWHTLHFVQSMLTPSTAHADARSFSLDARGIADYDDYVRNRASSVFACRAVDGSAADVELRAAQNAVTRLAEACRKQRIPLTLVLVPGDFQLSPQLTASFCRREELDPAALDLELPQRRWRALGEHLNVGVVDLLPTLRASGEVVYRENTSEWNDRGITLAAETIARGL
ncbi:MAG: hypothetical protein C0483_05230 [Pirellula sp.]|nr:hypothetical protein [Pirellula sp.]